MKFGKRVIVAVGLTDNISELLKPLRQMDFLKTSSEIHFVHAFNTINYNSWFGEFPLAYPIEADRKAIEEAVVAMLTKISLESVPKEFEGKIIQKCLFSEKPKDKFAEYVNEAKADLVIVPTRQRRGLFESSFAHYVNKHTLANMIMLKLH